MCLGFFFSLKGWKQQEEVFELQELNYADISAAEIHPRSFCRNSSELANQISLDNLLQVSRLKKHPVPHYSEWSRLHTG